VNLQGYPEGYPVLLPVEVTELRATEALQFLLDGNYFRQEEKQGPHS